QPVVLDGPRRGLRSEGAARKRDRSDVDIASGSCGRRIAARIQSHARRKRAQSEQVAQGHDGVESALLEIDAAAGSNHGPAIARDVPSHAKPGSEFIVIAVEVGFDLLSGLDESNVGIEVANQIIGLVDDSVDLIPQSKIDRNLRSSPPIVLNV